MYFFRIKVIQDSVNHILCSEHCLAIIDTGTNFIIGPLNDVLKLYSLINADLSLFEDYGLATVSNIFRPTLLKNKYKINYIYIN